MTIKKGFTDLLEALADRTVRKAARKWAKANPNALCVHLWIVENGYGYTIDIERKGKRGEINGRIKH